MGKVFSKHDHVAKKKKHRQSDESDEEAGKTKRKYSKRWKRKQHLKQMRRDRKAQHTSEEQVDTLSRELTRTAWYLGRRLGLSEDSVRKIIWNEPNEEAAKLCILMTWRKRNGWRATNQNLVILLEIAGYTCQEYKSVLPNQSNGHANIYEKAKELKEKKPDGYFRYDDFESSKHDEMEKKQSDIYQSTDEIINFARRSWKKPRREKHAPESKKPSSRKVMNEEIEGKRRVPKTDRLLADVDEDNDTTTPQSAREASSKRVHAHNLRNRYHSDTNLNRATNTSSRYNSESELNAIFKSHEKEKSEEDQAVNYKQEIMRLSKRRFESHSHQRKDSSLSNYSARKISLVRTISSDAIYNPDQQISGLILTKDNKIVIAENNNKEIQIFDTSGQFLRSFPTQSDLNPKGVGINLDGDIVVCCGKEVRILSTGGDLVQVFGEGSFRNNCYSVVCDAIGTYYVSDIVGHSISVFDVSGGIRKRFGNLGEKINNFNQPVALAINKENKLFISDSQNHCVKVYSLAGRPLEQIGEKGSKDGEFWNPFGLCFDGRGHLLVADCGNNRISLFNKRSYKFLRHVLTEKDGLHMPSYIRVSSTGHLVVCEWNSSQIKIFSFESAV